MCSGRPPRTRSNSTSSLYVKRRMKAGDSGKESTANDRGTGPATSASPASPANEEEGLWAIPLEAPELHDGAAALENRRELQRRMGGSSRLAPTGESNGIS